MHKYETIFAIFSSFIFGAYIGLGIGHVIRGECPNVKETKYVLYNEEENTEDLFEKEKQCLAAMVFGEARGESFYGKVGVAYTAINRYETGRYLTMCAVVLDTHQYTSFSVRPNLVGVATDPDRKPKIKNKIEEEAWEESKLVAELVYDDIIPDPTKGATHFLAPKKLKKLPKWARVYTKTAQIENHTFYSNKS